MNEPFKIKCSTCSERMEVDLWYDSKPVYEGLRYQPKVTSQPRVAAVRLKSVSQLTGQATLPQ